MKEDILMRNIVPGEKCYNCGGEYQLIVELSSEKDIAKVQRTYPTDKDNPQGVYYLCGMCFENFVEVFK